MIDKHEKNIAVQRYRQKMRDQGYRQYEIWLKPDEREKVKWFVDHIREHVKDE